MRHIEAIFDVCRLFPEEWQSFLDEYHSAHPGRAAPRHARQRHTRTLHPQVPMLRDEKRQEALELLIHDTVRRLCELVEWAYRAGLGALSGHAVPRTCRFREEPASIALARSEPESSVLDGS